MRRRSADQIAPEMHSRHETSITEDELATWNAQPGAEPQICDQAPTSESDSALRRFMALYDSLQWHMYL